MTGILQIVVARKPVEGTVSENCLKHGTGAINVDGCRIETTGEDLGDPNRFYGADNSTRQEWHRPHMTDEVMAEKHRKSFERLKSIGRFPANLILDESAAELLPDVDGPWGKKDGTSVSGIWKEAKSERKIDNARWNLDSGSASRFFFNFSEQESIE